MKKIYARFIILTALFAVLTVSPSTDALTVSPAILEMSGDPGAIITGTVRLFNEKEKRETFYTSFENFEPSDDSGTPRFIGAEDGLATWMSTTGTVTLDPKESLDIPFTVAIPFDTDPGGYFAAVFFGTQPPGGSGNVSIGGRLGVLTLLRVNGDIPEDGGILEYDTKNSQRFYTQPPVEFEYRFSNDGGDRVVPRGDIELKNTFGTIRETIEANPTEGSVLPASARRFKPSWEIGSEAPTGFFNTVKSQFNNFYFGYYSAEMNLGWGFTNQTATTNVSFFIIPWQLLVVVLGVFLILFVILKFGGKAYKESLMKQLQAQQEKITEEDAGASETITD